MLFSFLCTTMGRSDSSEPHILLLLEDKMLEFYFSMIKMHIWNRKMLVWHCYFFYFPLTLRRGSAVPRGNERENPGVFSLRDLCLSFCKGCFLSFGIWKCRAIWEGKADLISHCTHYPACSEGERTEKNNKIRIPFATVAFVFRPPIHRPCGVSYFAVKARAFALVVLTLNPKYFLCETCLLCVDVCFI